jgi:hypothetical protein
MNTMIGTGKKGKCQEHDLKRTVTWQDKVRENDRKVTGIRQDKVRERTRQEEVNRTRTRQVKVRDKIV